MTREWGEDIEGGAPKFFGHPKGGSKRIVGQRGGFQKFVYFKTST